jgi:hypothetical protein
MDRLDKILWGLRSNEVVKFRRMDHGLLIQVVQSCENNEADDSARLECEVGVLDTEIELSIGSVISNELDWSLERLRTHGGS